MIRYKMARKSWKPRRKMAPRRKVARKGGPQRKYTAVIRQTGRPQRMVAKLCYYTSGQLYNASGLFQTQLMNLNSLYDPDRSGVGHQPLGRDQWATWYNRYRVFKVDYVITFTNLDPDQAANCAIINQNGVPNYTDDSAFEQPGAYVSMVAPRDGGNSRLKIVGSVYLPRLNGKTPVAYKGNDDTQALMGANPLEVLTQALVVSPVIPASEVNVGYTIKYVYHCELFDPNTLGGS